MLHLLFPDATTLVIEDAVDVSVDPTKGSTDLLDQDGNVLATYARGQLVAFRHQPFPADAIEALRVSERIMETSSS